MNITFQAHLALLLTVILWSFHVVISRATITNLPPFTLHFLRMATALIAFLPFLWKMKFWQKKNLKKLLLISLGATGNLTFFILGIRYTSASASQLVYACQPLLIVVLETFLWHKKHSLSKTLGIILGFAGLAYIMYLSQIERGATISGDFRGNLIIVLAMLSWLSYLLMSKKLSTTYTPMELSSISILVTFLTSIPLFILERQLIQTRLVLNIYQLGAVVYMGLGGTFFTYLLHQFAIRHLTALKVSLSSYIQPITTAILAIIFLGEKLTWGFILGTMIVLAGIFTAVTFEMLKRRNTS